LNHSFQIGMNDYRDSNAIFLATESATVRSALTASHAYPLWSPKTIRGGRGATPFSLTPNL